MLVVPVLWAARLPPPADDAAEAAPQAPGAVAVAPGAPVALGRLRLLRPAAGGPSTDVGAGYGQCGTAVYYLV